MVNRLPTKGSGRRGRFKGNFVSNYVPMWPCIILGNSNYMECFNRLQWCYMTDKTLKTSSSWEMNSMTGLAGGELCQLCRPCDYGCVSIVNFVSGNQWYGPGMQLLLWFLCKRYNHQIAYWLHEVERGQSIAVSRVIEKGWTIEGAKHATCLDYSNVLKYRLRNIMMLNIKVLSTKSTLFFLCRALWKIYCLN